LHCRIDLFACVDDQVDFFSYAQLFFPGADINTKFAFPTIKSILKPVATSAFAPTTSNNSNNTNTNAAPAPNAGSAVVVPDALSALSAQPAQCGGCDLTPILLACANGRLNVVRELLWRKCDCRYEASLTFVLTIIAFECSLFFCGLLHFS
jgi:hypothetical protein